MRLKTYQKCVICGRQITPGTDCEASKPKGRPTVYAHSDCIKKRKERKDGRT